MIRVGVLGAKEHRHPNYTHSTSSLTPGSGKTSEGLPGSAFAGD